MKGSEVRCASRTLSNTLDGALREMCPNTELFLVRIQSECEKIRTRKNSVFGHFSCNGAFSENISQNALSQMFDRALIGFSNRQDFLKRIVLGG